MKDVNKVILVGRLGGDPIQRATKQGTAVVHFQVATSRRVLKEGLTEGAEDVRTEETQWHRVVVWGKQGEACAQYLKKGNPVYIEGSFRSHKYDGKDGQSRMAYEVYAENVSFIHTRAPDRVIEEAS
jgi:single-strand DNA-binding protein